MTIRNGMQASDLDVTWRKSSWSGPQGGNCVEFAKLSDGQVAIRNSRHPSGPALIFTPSEWEAFSKAVVGDEFELHLPKMVRGPRRLTQRRGPRVCGGNYAGRSNSPFLAPTRKASHSVFV
jgi:hypothetical protein